MILQIRLLGSPEFFLDSAPFHLARRKTTALLAYLADKDSPVAANSAAGLLWPEFAPDRARASLRHAISDAAAAAGLPIVERSGRNIRFNSQTVIESDVGLFRKTAAEGLMTGDELMLAKAATLYRGNFLEGFYLDDALMFEDWQLLEAENLKSQATEVLSRLAESNLASGLVVKAENWARRLSEISPLCGAAHRILMELSIARGDIADALNRYSMYAKILSRELGIKPDIRIEEIRAKIERHGNA
ncbi:MAG TPA: BTAD domain-containing putative transcriptional regulator [Rectinemataceae bacterium]|nr:BTAD domain-containing putative transcriptional regulator [Rectinemataceae bacterium]